jgi:hypothetical protein
MVHKAVQALKNYFIPHPGNDHKPHILRRRTIAFVFIVMLVAESAFIFGSAYVQRSRLFGIIEANALINETNQQRVTSGFAALQEDPLLDQAAQAKANDMAAKSYFAHTSPSGVTPWDWFEKAGYQFSYAGENLAVDFSNSQDVTNAWMNSPEHRANILNNNFTQIGMASAQGTYNGQPAIFVVEEFGTPASAPLSFVNTAAAATVTNPAPVTTPVASKPVAISKPKPKPKPIVVAPAAIVVASASVENSSSQQLFVAVKGAATTQAGSVVTTTAAAVATAPVTNKTAAPSIAGNWAQWLASNPRAVADDFYLLLIIIFAVASILNFFVKIRVQYPKLILGGLTVVVIAGLCVMMNQSIGLISAAII